MFSSRKTGSASNNYLLTRSLRFRSSASAYLNRTPGSATNRQIWTWSAWVKRGALGVGFLFSANSTSPFFDFFFNSGDQLRVFNYNGSSYDFDLTTNAVFRDPSSWYHIVLTVDTTQATNTNRVKLYVNNTQQTFTGSSYPTQNLNTAVNNNVVHNIAREAQTAGNYLDGYLTEINFIDGQALTPSSFGSTNAATGVWQPIKYTGTYGTNGFYLPFTNTTSTSTLGNDFSGNGNTWTVNNISLTAGTTYDSMTDVPTNTDTNTANYCVLNPLNNTGTTASANLNWNGTDKAILSTTAFPTTGKYYFEATCSTVANFSIIGIANAAIYASAFNGVIASANFRTYNSGGEKADSTRTASWGSTFTNNDIIGVAVDMDNGAIYFAKNNTWQASGVPTSGASKTGAAFTDLTSSGLTWTPFFSATNINGVWIANFGQRPFSYTPPAGFKALNTFNLPTPTIGASSASQANKYMDVSLYTGTNASLTITNSGSMQPDFIWTKVRSTSGQHVLNDSVRGADKTLWSSLTNAEQTNTAGTGITAFNSNGYTLGTQISGTGDTNASGSTYVGWQWRASNATAVTNTAGSITSTVSANTTAGFSIVTYTGTGSAGTIGHGLGVAPAMVMTKSRSINTGDGFVTYHKSLPSASYWLVLSSTGAQSGPNSAVWNGTAPTSTVFSVGTASGTNTNTYTYVAYCFAQVAGYSAFGSYTGNGSADGPFIYTGFRPRFVLFKRTDSAASWYLYDTSRSPYNTTNAWLRPDTSDAENSATTWEIDINSNGFKVRNSGAFSNASGGTYIYACFAESPFKFSLAR